MKKLNFVFIFLCLLGMGIQSIFAQQRQKEMYGAEMRKSKMKYIYSLEEARKVAYQQKKLIFVNCFAEWAAPCLGMDQYVFSDQEFCDYMDKTFVNLWIDMPTDAGKELAKEYGVESFAYYLILNYKGEVIQRIAGGVKLPEFKERVQIALNEKTSLAGSRKKYESGKYDKKALYNYLRALKIAGEDSLFRSLGKEYMAMLEPKEYPQEKNWIFTSLHRKRSSDYYEYMITHKSEFVKNNGEKKVNNYIESILCSDLLRYATGDTPYNAEKLADLRTEIERAVLPDTCPSNILYGVAQCRGEKKLHELLQYMNERGKFLSSYYGVLANIELSFNFPDITKEEREELVAYLQQASRREQGANAKRLAVFAQQVAENGKGIEFVHEPFATVLAKAKKEKKMIFMDCYTSWCGPCRALSSNIFSQPKVGSYFNAHFVNVKFDMEKGEGIELAKKYGVSAYPTLLFLDEEGNIVEKTMGYKTEDALIEIARKVVEKYNATTCINKTNP